MQKKIASRIPRQKFHIFDGMVFFFEIEKKFLKKYLNEFFLLSYVERCSDEVNILT